MPYGKPSLGVKKYSAKDSSFVSKMSVIMIQYHISLAAVVYLVLVKSYNYVTEQGHSNTIAY